MAVPVVTIDGPGGAGKGTVASAIAKGLGWHLLDSGALYRIIAVAGVADGICLLYTSPSPRDATLSRMPSSA